MWSRHRQQQQRGAQFRPPPRELREPGDTPGTHVAYRRDGDGVAESEEG
jgi:hypothetical protein